MTNPTRKTTIFRIIANQVLNFGMLIGLAYLCVLVGRNGVTLRAIRKAVETPQIVETIRTEPPFAECNDCVTLSASEYTMLQRRQRENYLIKRLRVKTCPQILRLVRPITEQELYK